MTVLYILGFVAVISFLYWGIRKLDSMVEAKFKYTFFDPGVFGIAFVSNLLLYFGNSWYKEALKKSGDLLNGELLMVFGGIGLLLVIFLNIRSTNYIVGIIGSAIQLTLFAVATFFGVLALIIIGAFLMGTRPVYVLNDK